MTPLPRCRRCGTAPEIVWDDDIVPGQTAWAIKCSNDDCYNDTHWQQSVVAASLIWQRNPCHNERGGQGDPSDDRSVVFA